MIAAFKAITLALIFGSCLSTPAWAGESEIIDLHGSWKLRIGDDPAWARPHFDDTDWASVDFVGWGKLGYPGYSGIAWYRRTFEVPRSKADEIRPAILMGKITSAYEIFADGILLGGVGSLPPEPIYDYDRHALFRVPAGVYVDGRVHIAIRVWGGPTLDATGGGPFDGSFLLGDERELAEHMVLSEMPRVFFSLIFLLVGFLHLYLYWRRRRSSSYLWFGLLTLAIAAYSFLLTQWKYMLGLDFDLLKEVEYLIIMVAPALLAQFLWSLFESPLPRILRAYQVGTVGLGLAVSLTPGLRFNLMVLNPWLAVLIPVLIWMALIMAREAWRGRPEARGMAIGFSIFVVTAVLDSLGQQGYLPPTRWLTLGFATFLLSMAVILADRFSRIYSEVESLRSDLESKVRMQTAELEARTREAQKANQAKSRFLATVSHELRSPLNAILGFTDILRRHDSPGKHERHGDFLSYIARSGSHLLALINDILDLSKIESGKMEPHFEQVDLAEIVNGVCSVCRGVASPNRVQIKQTVPDDLPTMILDPVMIKQVLWNLLSNAVKFSPPDSEVSVSVETVEQLDTLRDTSSIALTVRDQGIGIAPEDHERIFEEFQQLDDDAERKRQGTGLGLALVSKFVKLHKGTISLHSQLGEGCSFQVIIPVATQLGLEDV